MFEKYVYIKCKLTKNIIVIILLSSNIINIMSFTVFIQNTSEE